MQDIRFGRTFSLRCSGLLTTPRRADLAMLYRLVEKMDWDQWKGFVYSNTTFVLLSVYSTLV